jgi:hypothetical protein
MGNASIEIVEKYDEKHGSEAVCVVYLQPREGRNTYPALTRRQIN